MKKALVTGATGQDASCLIKLLLSKGLVKMMVESEMV